MIRKNEVINWILEKSARTLLDSFFKRFNITYKETQFVQVLSARAVASHKIITSPRNSILGTKYRLNH